MTEKDKSSAERIPAARPSLPGRVVVALLFFVVALVVAYAVNRVMYGDDEIPAGRQRLQPEPTAALDSAQSLFAYSLTPDDIARYRAAGLTDPATQILYDLINHNEIIPDEGTMGGTMFFFPSESHFVGPDRVLAYYEDGHMAGRLLLRFKVADGEISWEVSERLPPPTP